MLNEMWQDGKWGDMLEEEAMACFTVLSQNLPEGNEENDLTLQDSWCLVGTGLCQSSQSVFVNISYRP
jgi:hypothetical protein